MLKIRQFSINGLDDHTLDICYYIEQELYLGYEVREIHINTY